MNVILLPSMAFLADDSAIISQPSQIHHIHHVLKADVGDYLKIACLGDKLGTARIDKFTPHAINLTDVRLDTPPPLKLDITVVLALPRPKTLRRLVIDMTALGVKRIILVNSYRTDKSYWQSPMLTRLDEFVYQGLEQGVDCVPPMIQLEKRFKPFVQDCLPNLGERIVVAHPYANQAFLPTTPLPDVLIVGAEGGFIAYEIDLLTAQGATVLSLGKRILRTESAVNVLLGRWL